MVCFSLMRAAPLSSRLFSLRHWGGEAPSTFFFPLLFFAFLFTRMLNAHARTRRRTLRCVTARRWGGSTTESPSLPFFAALPVSGRGFRLPATRA
ncbi:hypothetical protein ABB37_08868 [Leptomonas pyrrhocoris]|uniref:Uncharacterized protein n=1 Tax=Leptomonas pyrrhocoris TaxID=157538 RepID=A0A0N0DRY9_LEPPY|nr:hypothetical protein ABB37_08868 [Leptomonas pyrrhocoris]XP_015653291.1 hypothetical protein ABB37_08868 [Leptomonas pyrrhocoris]XP_015653292.1 hypothetical protein ABB37_08868 [Leptomonas pyrrhocoris]XP_015653293.1 hypothetical protein ABB37_08868 [Leptomonas pyrrhocoris]XP_015653294.1 hypothetical protein ABB37_08868 [Leptomonas pyrrhocoris]KPA74851.1 hypothetical protein ABB37_08868 [Leptomonas pyrrhocoris]KPA74852.1 hypothetical protein ABB37_08868 [Leptomonas pyrrhocoris]KPA74853.1 h|eukprot:XP_015653290.1 hypothetical protein ABB37_08868 [Leptomonas pyrrhocoris]